MLPKSKNLNVVAIGPRDSEHINLQTTYFDHTFFSPNSSYVEIVTGLSKMAVFLILF